MKCVITGHTSGIGRALSDHFIAKGWEVVGMSRSNGYNIKWNQDKIIEDATGCDLFINNANSPGDSQLELLQSLCTKVKKIVTIGDAGTYFSDIWEVQYTKDMAKLEEHNRLISLSPDIADTLHIKLSTVENTYTDIVKTRRVSSDYTISYQDIINAVEFWLANPKVRQIEFGIKLTDQLVTSIKECGGNSTALDTLIEKTYSLINGSVA